MPASIESGSWRRRRGFATAGLALLAALAWRETTQPEVIAPSTAHSRNPPRARSATASVSFAASGVMPSEFETGLDDLRLSPASADRSQRLTRFIAVTAAPDPDEALCALARIEDDAFRRECVHAFFVGWVAREPTTLAAWLLAQPIAVRAPWAGALIADLADTPEAIQQIVPRLVHGDPERAADYLRPALAALTARGDFPLAATLTALADDPLLRGPLRETLAAGWTDGNPRAAAAWILTLADSPERDGILGRLAETWSTAQPAALAAFATTLPGGLGRTHALTLAVQAWAERDVEAATRWLAERMPADELDTPAFALATNPAVLAASPVVAARWAEAIANPDVRLQGLRAVLEQWAMRDPAAAKDFVRATPVLSDPFRHTLLAEIDHE